MTIPRVIRSLAYTPVATGYLVVPYKVRGVGNS